MQIFGYIGVVLLVLFAAGLLVAGVIEVIISGKAKKGTAAEELKPMKKVSRIIALSALGCLILGVVFIFVDHNVSMEMRKSYVDEKLFG